MIRRWAYSAEEVDELLILLEFLDCLLETRGVDFLLLDDSGERVAFARSARRAWVAHGEVHLLLVEPLLEVADFLLGDFKLGLEGRALEGAVHLRARDLLDRRRKTRQRRAVGGEAHYAAEAAVLALQGNLLPVRLFGRFEAVLVSSTCVSSLLEYGRQVLYEVVALSRVRGVSAASPDACVVLGHGEGGLLVNSVSADGPVLVSGFRLDEALNCAGVAFLRVCR